jgi:two-component system, chemotaxis family, chemotaxis protein CheY
MNKVLVIEDDAPLCWLLEKILRGKYEVIDEVIVMNNGLEAWSWLSDGNSCDLIISDVRMPSLSGIELLENLSNSGLFRNIPVIMLSGLEDSRDECLSLGAFAYLVKPFEPQKFLNEVSRALLQNSDKVLMS